MVPSLWNRWNRRQSQQTMKNMAMMMTTPSRFSASSLLRDESCDPPPSDTSDTRSETDTCPTSVHTVSSSSSSSGHGTTTTTTTSTTKSTQTFADMTNFFHHPLSMIVVFGVFLSALWVWKTWKSSRLESKRCRLRQRHDESATAPAVASPPAPISTTTPTNQHYESKMEQYESLVSALHDELQAKSMNENEMAILWRQEKNILQSRIEALHQQQQHQETSSTGSSTATSESNNNDYKRENKRLLAKVKDLQASVVFLTQLTESQQENLEAKQNEIDKLHNIMEEMRETLMLDTTPITKVGQKRRSTTTGKKSSRGRGKDEDDRNLLSSRVELHPKHVQDEPQQALFLRTSQRGETDDEETTIESVGCNTEDLDDDHDDDDSEFSSTTSDTTSSGGSDLIHSPLRPTTPTSHLQNNNKVVLLVSSMPGKLETNLHQSRLQAIFRQGLCLPDHEIEVVDGCDPNLHGLRDDLFRISGLHAKYPQVFLITGGGTEMQFVGDYETIVDLHDSRELPERIGLVLGPSTWKDHHSEEDDDAVTATQ